MNVSLEYLHQSKTGDIAVARFHPTGEYGSDYDTVATLSFKGKFVYIVGLLSTTNFTKQHMLALTRVLEQIGVKEARIRRNIHEDFRPFKFSLKEEI